MKIDKFISIYNCCMTPPPGKEWEDLGEEMKADLLKVVKHETKRAEAQRDKCIEALKTAVHGLKQMNENGKFLNSITIAEQAIKNNSK